MKGDFLKNTSIEKISPNPSFPKRGIKTWKAGRFKIFLR
jgi:hypothetical protein